MQKGERYNSWVELSSVDTALLMMGLYHLVIFFSRKTNLASLALAAYCLLRTVNSLCSKGSD